MQDRVRFEMANIKQTRLKMEYVTISMGKVGKISRLTADLTGSSWSYARVGDESAPGQIPLENMRRIRELLNED